MKRTKKILFYCLAILLVFLSLEGALRLYCLALKNHRIKDYISRITTDSYYIPYTYRIFAYKPSYRYESSDGKRSHQINSRGFVGPEFLTQKSPNTFRIICVGASTTANFENSTDADTYPAQLEKHLSTLWPHTNVEVINAGIRGYNTAETLIYFSFNLIDLSPDLIILYHGFNDLLPNSYPDFKSDYSHFRRPAWQGLILERTFLEKIFEQSFLFLFLRARLTNYNRLHNVISYSSFPPPPNPYAHLSFGSDSLQREGYDTFERNLRSILAVAKSRDIQVVLPTFTHLIRQDTRVPYPLSLRKMLAAGIDEHNRRIRKVWSEDPDIISADIDKELTGKSQYFFDFIHFNDLGSEKVAEILATAISDKRQ